LSMKAQKVPNCARSKKLALKCNEEREMQQASFIISKQDLRRAILCIKALSKGINEDTPLVEADKLCKS